MEKLKVKHDHTLTDILKVLIFTLMLLLPGICFIPNALYYGFNEHATAQEKTIQEPIYYESNEVTTIDDINLNNIYHINYNGSSLGSTCYIKWNEIFDNEMMLGSGTVTSTQIYDYPYVARISGYASLYYFDQNTTGTVINYWSCDIVFSNKDNLDVFLPYISICEKQYLKAYQDITYSMSISDSMYQAWEDLWQTPLLNWTNTTPFNNGLNNFVGVFGITQNSYLANCLIYILTITAIYVVFDIVLSMFKWLTHLIGSK